MSSDRKSQLAALSAKAGRNIPPSTEPTDEPSKPTLSFRNYTPKDVNLSLPIPSQDKTSSASRDTSSKRQKTLEGQSSALEQALAKVSQDSQAGTSWSRVTLVTSHKANWDLKRDISHKMERLERRTQRAIVELLRERLEKEAGEGRDGESDLD